MFALVRLKSGADMRFLHMFGVLSLACLGIGCAGDPQVEVPQTTFVSPIMYETFGCEQISQEAKDLIAKTETLSGVKSEGTLDKNVITWPSALLTHAAKEQKASLSHIRNQFEALEKAAQREKCEFRFQKQVAQSQQDSTWITSIRKS